MILHFIKFIFIYFVTNIFIVYSATLQNNSPSNTPTSNTAVTAPSSSNATNTSGFLSWVGNLFQSTPPQPVQQNQPQNTLSVSSLLSSVPTNSVLINDKESLPDLQNEDPNPQNYTVLIPEPDKPKPVMLVHEKDHEGGIPAVLIQENNTIDTAASAVLVKHQEEPENTLLYLEPIVDPSTVLYVDNDEELLKQTEAERKARMVYLIHEPDDPVENVKKTTQHCSEAEIIAPEEEAVYWNQAVMVSKKKNLSLPTTSIRQKSVHKSKKK